MLTKLSGRCSIILLAVLLAQASTASAQSFLEKLGFKKSGALTNLTVAALSDEQVVGGLKEALSKGVQQAISQLGRADGFLTNLNVKIPMPENLQKVEKTLRSLKQDHLADEFVTTMNRAAEQAVPEAAAIFGGAIKQMSFADAKSILSGQEDAATQFFRKTSTNALRDKFLPIVKAATEQTGVTASYKRMTDKLNTGGSLTKSFGTALGSFGYSVPSGAEIDEYVTARTMDGLFKMVAEEEKRIRQNPAARTTDLLKQVFGATTK